MSDTQTVSAAVAKLYDTYPFPPVPIVDEPPQTITGAGTGLRPTAFVPDRNRRHGKFEFWMQAVAPEMALIT